MTNQLAERRVRDGALPVLHTINAAEHDQERHAGVPNERDSVIERTALRLRQLVYTTTMELTLNVGAVIVEGLYGGSLKAWRKRGRKCNSLRALAGRPDLPMSAASIYRSVAIYELVARAGGIERLSRLSVGHFRAVLGVSADAQLAYLRAADEQAWTASELEARTRQDRRARGRHRGGRRPIHPIVRAVRSAARALDGELPERSSLEPLAEGPCLEAVRSELQTLLSRVLDLVEVVGATPSLPAHGDGRG